MHQSDTEREKRARWKTGTFLVHIPIGFSMKKEKKTSSAKAVALMYDAAREGAPRVAAKGSGELAKKILELAREHNVPIRQDPDLLALLIRVDVLDEVPADLYQAVAEILAFIYDVNQRKTATLTAEEKTDVERNIHSRSGDGTPADETRNDGE